MSAADDQFRYARIVAKDRAYDGQFLTGVHTTGIYCLPSCPARKPKFENVSFFDEEAEALAAGLRPCKRCRPDIYHRGSDWDAELYQNLLARLRCDITAVKTVADLCALSGISSSKFNELLRVHGHLRPTALLRRERVHRVKALLLETKDKVIDVGHAAGFDSEATFHRQFSLATGLTPGAYRALRDADGFLIQLPANYAAADVLGYFARDPAQLAERVSGRTVCKAFTTENGPAILSIEFRDDSRHAWCQWHADRPLSLADRAHAHALAVRMLGLSHDAPAFEARANSEPEIARLLGARTGLRPPLTATVFEALVWAIVGQQVNIRFATTLRSVAIELAGQRVSGSSLYLHPSPSQLAGLDVADLTSRKFSGSKAAYLLGAAQSVASGALALETLRDGSALLAERALLALRGVGPWSAAYVMLRGIGFDDCVPVGDSGLNEGLKRFFALPERPDPARTRQLMQVFSPHCTLATSHLWASLKEGG